LRQVGYLQILYVSTVCNVLFLFTVYIVVYFYVNIKFVILHPDEGSM